MTLRYTAKCNIADCHNEAADSDQSKVNIQSYLWQSEVRLGCELRATPINTTVTTRSHCRAGTMLQYSQAGGQQCGAGATGNECCAMIM
ncbi:hypothetical protein J6590_055369 [Homalodisca vitripennis]|nr:hypothetical protein J6590_055369 [Homalodisca vitripennis]